MGKEGTDIGWYQILLLVVFGFALGFVMPKPVEQETLQMEIVLTGDVVVEDVEVVGAPVAKEE